MFICHEYNTYYSNKCYNATNNQRQSQQATPELLTCFNETEVKPQTQCTMDQSLKLKALIACVVFVNFYN